MKIGELAGRAGLKPSAIRYYERLGILEAPHRVGGQRRYAADTLDRVLLIRFAADMGFTLAEIKLFLAGLQNNTPVGPRWKKLAHAKIKQVNDTMQRSRRLKALLEHLLHCRCPSLQVCVRRLSLSPEMKKLESYS
ncbi:MAG TPA: MerR family transcriptional regulator [Candidatus Saccharimonadales bacterium]|nr:MerR family transcriptional regulator [Candidatus Saccharimonadales bacterium]